MAKSKTSKPSKPGAKLLRLKLQLDEKRADGMTYTVEKEIRGQEDRDSKFGEFMMKIFTDEGALNQFFSTYRLSMLLNRRCALKLKEVRRKGQSVEARMRKNSTDYRNNASKCIVRILAGPNDNAIGNNQRIHRCRRYVVRQAALPVDLVDLVVAVR